MSDGDGAGIVLFTAESAVMTVPTVDSAAEHGLDATPLDTAAGAVKPAAQVTSRKKASSFLLSLLQGLNVATYSPPSSFLHSAGGADASASAGAIDGSRQATDHIVAGGSTAGAAESAVLTNTVYQSRFPLVQMVLAGLLGNTTASEKCA